MIFKKGDWCFYEFNLSLIMRMEHNKVTEVTDGTIRSSGNNLTDACFPLELSIKVISDVVDYWSKQFHAIKINGLNHPDLHRELVRRWIEMCNYKDNAVKLSELQDSLSKFGWAVVNKARDLKSEEIEGIALFRR